MPICIECGFKLATLYTTYSKADDRSLGKGVRLTQCPRCKRFADKYVEHDYVVIFIDLILIKPQVYRHLLFNRLGREDDRFDPSIVRLGILLLLFDVYLTWARIEKATSPPPHAAPSILSPDQTGAAHLHQASASSALPGINSGNAKGIPHHPLPGQGTAVVPFSAFLSTQPIILQYLFFLTLCFSETAAFHLPIRWVLGLFPPSPAEVAATATSPSTALSSAAPSVTSSPVPSPPIPPRAPTRQNSTSLSSGTAASRQPSPAPPSPLSPLEPLASNVPPDAGVPPPTAAAAAASAPLIPYYPHPSVISTALLVSSFTKLFPLLLLVWSYDLPSSASAVSWAVIVNNVAALEILLDCGFPRAIGLAAVGAVCRALVGWGVLRAVGVEGGVAAAAVVETGDVVEFGRKLASWLGLAA